MPTLYVVGTPIGNLEDITLRAIRVLQEVSVIAAEDTRTTRKLLTKYGIKTRLVSYHQFSRPERTEQLLDMLDTQDIALVSDAGTPGIHDPGYPLVRAAVQRGVTVVPLPGPSAVSAALAVSGLSADQFLFLGFLPRRPKDRRTMLASLLGEARTAVAFEAPHRIRKTLKEIADILGRRPLVVCRELTKLYEEVYHGDAAGAAERFAQPRGEFTLVLGGCGLDGSDYWQEAPLQSPAATPARTRQRKRSA